MAHAAFIWAKQHLREPWAVRLGRVKRRGKLGSSVISDFVSLRKSLFLCASCVHAMPWGWLKRFEYRLIPNMHSEWTRCDRCQEIGNADVFHPEGPGTYFEQYQRLKQTSENAAAQQVAVMDRRRIRGL